MMNCLTSTYSFTAMYCNSVGIMAGSLLKGQVRAKVLEISCPRHEESIKVYIGSMVPGR